MTQTKPTPDPLPDVPDGTPGYRAVFITLETVQTRGRDGRHTGITGHWVRRRYSDKPLVWIPGDVCANPSGPAWAAVFMLPVWYFRKVREGL